MNLIKLILYLKSKYNLFFYSRNDYLNFFFKLLNKFFAKKQEQLTVLISLNSEFLFLTKDNLLNKKYLLFPINLHNFFNKKGQKSFLHAAWQDPVANYLSRNNLNGNYVEMGVFWGRSFIQNYYNLINILKGKFYGFCSFEGLIGAKNDESFYSGGDFVNNNYYFTYDNFIEFVNFLELDKKKIEIFKTNLNNPIKLPETLLPKSISFINFDLDLYCPTLNVLNHIESFLDNGALIRFDNFRLSRASINCGERGAVIEWLNNNPNLNLLEFPSNYQSSIHSWQEQIFIFHRAGRE